MEQCQNLRLSDVGLACQANTMMLFKVILFSYQVQFFILKLSNNENESITSLNVFNKCKKKQQIIWLMRGCMDNFVITFKPYLDFCQSQNLLKIQEIEKQSIHTYFTYILFYFFADCL